MAVSTYHTSGANCPVPKGETRLSASSQKLVKTSTIKKCEGLCFRTILREFPAVQKNTKRCYLEIQIWFYPKLQNSNLKNLR